LAPTEALGATAVCRIGAPRPVKAAKPSKSRPSATRSVTAKAVGASGRARRRSDDSNAAGVIPVVEALMSKGAPLGAVLAFMMSVIALSLPEMVILRKVMTLRLIAVFVGVVATGVLAVGYLFNAIL
jgi:hypothetical protein